MRDVVVLGWWKPEQQRVSFLKLLRTELGLGLADAKSLLDESLTSGSVVVIPVAPSSRAQDVARSILGMGAEVRVLPGHASPHQTGSVASHSLSRLKVELAEWFAGADGGAPDSARGVGSDFVPAEEAGSGLLAQAARHLDSIEGHTIRAQDRTLWRGELELPTSLVDYYRDFGPLDLGLSGYGNDYFLPSLAALWEHQAGYRWDGVTGQAIDDWNDDWLVIADCGGDPFILSRSTGQVLFAEHGMGTWEPSAIFPSIDVMAAALCAIGSIAACAGPDLTDEESYVRPIWRGRIEAELDDILEPGTAGELLQTLGWG